MAALEQVHAHERVPLPQEGLVGRQVGGRPGEGLDIDEDILCRDPGVGETGGAAALRQDLHEMHVVRAFIETAVGITPVIGQLMAAIPQMGLVLLEHGQRGPALSIDVGENARQGLPHGAGGQRLRGNQNQPPGLSLFLPLDEPLQVGVHLGQRRR